MTRHQGKISSVIQIGISCQAHQHCQQLGPQKGEQYKGNKQQVTCRLLPSTACQHQAHADLPLLRAPTCCQLDQLCSSASCGAAALLIKHTPPTSRLQSTKPYHSDAPLINTRTRRVPTWLRATHLLPAGPAMQLSQLRRCSQAAQRIFNADRPSSTCRVSCCCSFGHFLPKLQ